jgi:glycosyltransferase involved in cell wall biosynthesis
VRHAVLSINGDLSGASRLATRTPVPCAAAKSRSISSLRREVRRFRPGAVFTYGWGGVDGVIAARLAGVRRIVHHEDGFLPDERSGEKPFRRLARRFAFRFARGVVVPSQTLMEFGRKSWWVSPKRLLYIPNGVDVRHYRPAANHQERSAARRAIGLPDNAIIAGTVGGLRPEKNQLRLVRAFGAIAHRAPSSRLLIVGDGPLEEAMRAEAARLGVTERVHFTGPTGDPSPYYRAMDVFALSSDTEQMPLALLEASATGLPTVSTNVGDVVQMVSHENREYITTLGDDEAFARQLLAMLSDSKLRAKVGEANRVRCVKHYSVEQMVASHRQLYEGNSLQ